MKGFKSTEDYRITHRKGRCIQIMWKGTDKWVSTGCNTEAEFSIWIEEHTKKQDVLFKTYARDFFIRTDPQSIRYDDEIRGRKALDETYDFKESITRIYLIPFFGELKVKQITTKMIDKWFLTIETKHGKQPSSHYRNIILSALNIILDRAVYDEIIETNPAKNVSRVVARTKKKKPLSKEELAILFPNFAEERTKVWENTITACFFSVFYDTGFRPCEILALEWENVNLNQKTVYTESIVDTYSKKVVNRIKTTNTGKKYKVGVLSDITIELLSKLDKSSKYIFYKKAGRLSTTVTTNYRFKQIAKKRLGRDDVSQYTLRHAFMTNLIGKVPKEVVMELMGHVQYESCYDDRDKDRIVSDMLKMIKPYS